MLKIDVEKRDVPTIEDIELCRSNTEKEKSITFKKVVLINIAVVSLLFLVGLNFTFTQGDVGNPGFAKDVLTFIIFSFGFAILVLIVTYPFLNETFRHAKNNYLQKMFLKNGLLLMVFNAVYILLINFFQEDQFYLLIVFNIYISALAISFYLIDSTYNSLVKNLEQLEPVKDKDKRENILSFIGNDVVWPYHNEVTSQGRELINAEYDAIVEYIGNKAANLIPDC
jgi:predicted neutral ceramidase superfamily lipid hydrolase